MLAACCFLADGLPSRAVGELLRSHQLEIALALCLALNLPALQIILRMLAARAERHGQWELALTLLQRGREPSAHVALLAARCFHASERAVGGGTAPDLYGAVAPHSHGARSAPRAHSAVH